MSAAAQVQDTETSFFRNYNRLVGGTYAAILLCTVAVFLFQLHEKLAEEINTIKAQVAKHGQLIEFTLRSSQDALEALRLSMADSYARGTAAPSASASPLLPYLRQGGAGFNLDLAPQRDATGNLTGLGTLGHRSAAFNRDLRAALQLAPAMQAIAFNLPQAVNAGFVSADHFAYQYPWVESSKRAFADSFYDSPTWQFGTPERNANREKYWAPVEYGDAGQGLVAPAAAPVYDGDQFRGVVNIDTSLDYLNRINSDFGYPLGTVLLVDDYGQVVAHPKLFANALSVQATRPLADALPPELADDPDRLVLLPADTPTQMQGWLAIRHPFISAPWQLVYLVPTSQVWIALLRERALPVALLVIGLTVLMGVTYRVTSREFISPANKLVGHIAAESRFVTRPIPAVPASWRPWFETISQAFRESLQLAGIRQELDIAANVQRDILPRRWPQHEAFAMWGLMRSAREIGGDFYDYFELDSGRFGLVVADVSGKGVPAALFGMVSKTLLRATALRFPDAPGEVMASVNTALCEDNDACTFVTVFYAVYDPARGILHYVTAGHPPPLLVAADGRTRFLEKTGGAALGVMEDMAFAQATVALAPGDTLLAYTDGVTEAIDTQGTEFTANRLPPVFGGRAVSEPQQGVESLVAAVDRFAGGAAQFDDITCVALHRT
ncbi:MAG: SpoIIE family protein phosphatase [Ramlibacter sp.]|nr:SpoIIE family protein phosphatase [Ramlibacter sp.]